jgi:hypothetical protein
MATVKKYGAEASVAETPSQRTPAATAGLESKEIQVTLTESTVKLSDRFPLPTIATRQFGLQNYMPGS